MPELADKKWFELSNKLIKDVLAYENVIVAGAGDRGKILIKALLDIGVNVPFAIDNVITGYTQGIPIVHPDVADYSDACVIVSLSEKSVAQGIKEQLIQLQVRENRILLLTDYVHPAIQAHEVEYFDDESIINYGEYEAFVDCGVLDFETSANYIQKCNEHGVKDIHIFGFEPQPVNYDNSVKNAKKYENVNTTIKIYPNAVWSKDETLQFNGAGDAAHIVSGKGEMTVSAVKMDSVIDEPVTYIKMDIEGAELEALKGAQGIIKRYRPKLAISLYHKPIDIIEIPLYIKQLNPPLQ